MTFDIYRAAFSIAGFVALLLVSGLLAHRLTIWTGNFVFGLIAATVFFVICQYFVW